MNELKHIYDHQLQSLTILRSCIKVEYNDTTLKPKNQSNYTNFNTFTTDRSAYNRSIQSLITAMTKLNLVTNIVNLNIGLQSKYLFKKNGYFKQIISTTDYNNKWSKLQNIVINKKITKESDIDQVLNEIDYLNNITSTNDIRHNIKTISFIIFFAKNFNIGKIRPNILKYSESSIFSIEDREINIKTTRFHKIQKYNITEYKIKLDDIHNWVWGHALETNIRTRSKPITITITYKD